MISVASILQWTQIAMAAVAVAESTATSETTGATKKQTALDIIKNEAGLAAQVAPAQNTMVNSILNTIVDGVVLVNNAQGVFTHKTTAAAAGTVGS